MKKTILIVEDEAHIREMICFSLQQEDYTLLEAESTTQATEVLKQHRPDLILLDWMLPGSMSGLKYAKQLKSQDSHHDIPIILLTAKAEEDNKIKGFESGVDDYITKPFSPRELVARIKAVLRRGPAIMDDNVIKIDSLRLNQDTHEVTINNELIDLPPIEYRLLAFFLNHQEKVYSRDQLLNFVWGDDCYVEERTVDVQIRRLRSKLQQYSQCVQTVRSEGYRFSIKPLSQAK